MFAASELPSASLPIRDILFPALGTGRNPAECGRLPPSLNTARDREGGTAIANVRIRDGRRLSVFRTYVYPYMDRHNLTVLTGALVTRIVFDGKRAAGVEFLRNACRSARPSGA
jgi:choline dehydrogenase-like flavoprotein